MKRRVQLAGEGAHHRLSVRGRCNVLGVCRARLYYRLVPRSDALEVTVMNEIADIYAQRPFQGYKRIADDLKERGLAINHKRVYRLMKVMGLEAVYPKKNLSKRRQDQAVFPYLLRMFPPHEVHDCWCIDITYIKTRKGFIYLTALIDVVSRYVVGFSVSNGLDTASCVDALAMAVERGYKPRMINSDQGCQFTSQEWLYQLALLGIRVSMDGKGRCLDNIPIERFWRTLKYEEVYLRTYESVTEARTCLAAYIHWYNKERRHSGIGKRRPWEVMKASQAKRSKGAGYVDKAHALTHIPTPLTTAALYEYNMNIGNLSLRRAA